MFPYQMNRVVGSYGTKALPRATRRLFDTWLHGFQNDYLLDAGIDSRG